MNDGVNFSRSLLTIWTTAAIVFVLGPLVFVVLVSSTPLNYISLPVSGVS